jgi:hypothetical protein
VASLPELLLYSYTTRFSPFNYDAFRKLWRLSRNYYYTRTLQDFLLSTMMRSVNCGVSPGINTRIPKYTTGCSSMQHSSKNYLLYFVEVKVATSLFQRSEFSKLSSFLILGIQNSLFWGGVEIYCHVPVSHVSSIILFPFVCRLALCNCKYNTHISQDLRIRLSPCICMFMNDDVIVQLPCKILNDSPSDAFFCV